MPAKSQRGIRRPRVSEPDLDLRKAILRVLRDIQRKDGLRKIAGVLGVSEKTLSRYMSDRYDRPPTLGGDVLFRLCEAGYPVTCRGRTLKCVRTTSSRLRSTSEQLQFEFIAGIDVLLPSRKLVARVERVTRRRVAG